MLTACPLDCYDGCSIIYEDGRLKADSNHPITKGYLCSFLNRYFEFERIKYPRLNGEQISMDEALGVLSEKLKKSCKTLLFRGSGNLGRMQDVTNLFFSKLDSVMCDGSLCDGAGDAGIEEGRGVSLHLSPNVVAKSDVVIIWGRNISVTNSHMLPILKGKTLIVIDPIKTDIAKKADFYLQIPPKSDIYLAILLSRFVYMEQMEDEDFIEQRTKGYDDFIDFIKSYPISHLLEKCEIDPDTIYALLLAIKDKKVSILVGVGVQKYSFGHLVLRAIDSFAAQLGLFGKDGCGVGYLGQSGFGYKNPFEVKAKKVCKPMVDFSDFDLVFIQGANPATQMPDSKRVKEGLESAGFVVYFGLYENETSALSDLVIPAKSFLEKNDIKLTYGHEYVGIMPKIIDTDFGISEYDLTKYLFCEFGYSNLKEEKEYIEEIVSSNSFEKDGYLASLSYKDTPYKERFYTDDSFFHFIDEFEEDEEEEEGRFLLTLKDKSSLNSQFINLNTKVANCIYLPKDIGFDEGDRVKASSDYGEFEFEVKIDERLRQDCILLYSGNKGVNYLTPSKISQEGKNAIYQDVKVRLEIIAHKHFIG